MYTVSHTQVHVAGTQQKIYGSRVRVCAIFKITGIHKTNSYAHILCTYMYVLLYYVVC